MQTGVPLKICWSAAYKDSNAVEGQPNLESVTPSNLLKQVFLLLNLVHGGK